MDHLTSPTNEVPASKPDLFAALDRTLNIERAARRLHSLVCRWSGNAIPEWDGVPASSQELYRVAIYHIVEALEDER